MLKKIIFILFLTYFLIGAIVCYGSNIKQKDLDIFSRVIDGEAGICSRKAKINVCAFILNHAEFDNRSLDNEINFMYRVNKYSTMAIKDWQPSNQIRESIQVAYDCLEDAPGVYIQRDKLIGATNYITNVEYKKRKLKHKIILRDECHTFYKQEN